MPSQYLYGRARSILPTIAAAVLIAGLSACSSLRLGSVGGGDLRATSLDGNMVMRPDIVTEAYARVDPNTADIYLSDLSEKRLIDPADDLAGLSGSLIHIHLFLIPEAGSTPIDSTACDFTMRQIILAAGEKGTVMGMYGGGGFLYPDGEPGDSTLGGSITNATHRLIRAMPGFKDLLGTATLSGTFSAPRNESTAKALEARFDSLLSRLPTRPVDSGHASGETGKP